MQKKNSQHFNFKKWLCQYRHQVTLVIIILVAFFIRFHHLGSLPQVLNRDEAALAYNAYLISTASVDEWGKTRPLLFQSFGDYKLPGYIYTLAAIFGSLKVFSVNTIWSDYLVRLPGALAGLGIVVLAYYFAKIFTKRQSFPHWWSLVLPALLAITPVLIWYSRGAWEANVGLFFSLLAAYILLREGLKTPDKKAWRWPSLTALALSLIAASAFYNSPLICATALLPFLPLLYGWKNYRRWLPPLLTLAATCTAIFIVLAPLTSQKNDITLFSDPTFWNFYPDYRASFTNNPIASKLLGNQYVYLGERILVNLGASFSPNFLLRSGGSHPWHQLDHGFVHFGLQAAAMFYASLATTLIAVAAQLFKKAKKAALQLTVPVKTLFLMLVALAPAIITTDAPHATRSLLFFVLINFLIWYQLASWRTQISKKIWTFIAVAWLLLVSAHSGTYLWRYFVWFPQNQERYGTSLVSTFQDLAWSSPEKKIIVGGDVAYNYILAAWYTKMPASVFLNTIQRSLPTIANLYAGEALANFVFVGEDSELAP